MKINAKLETLNIQSTDTQKVNVKIAPTAADGSPAIVTSVWAITSGDATLAPAADGNSCFFISGALGVTSVGTCTSTADDGSTLVLSVNYSVSGSTTATALNASADAPVSK